MPWLGTFHAIGMRILRRHSELVGLSQNFTILDTDDQIRLIKQLLQAERLDEKRWPARQLAGLIDGWKNKGLVPEKVPASDAYNFANGRAHRALRRLSGRGFKEAERGGISAICCSKNIRLFLEEPPTFSKQYHRWFTYINGGRISGHQRRAILWLRLAGGEAATISVRGR